ncbi:MAG: hypothetical protein C0506_04670 [Anaerolinea sp.]|nr:hypothetical protein [Anaerolinea sp.]
MLLLFACSGDSKQPRPPPAGPLAEPTPTAFAIPSPANIPCPVEQPICDFAAGIEKRLRNDDAAGLGDQWGGASLLDMLKVTGGPIRLVSIGCPRSPDGVGDTCARGFVLAFSSLPDGLELKDMRGQVVIGFTRAGAAMTPASVYAFPEGDQRRIVSEGGDVSDCRVSQFLGPMVEGYCRRVTFHPYRTPEPPPPPPVAKPPLAAIPGVTVREFTPGPPSSIPPGGIIYYVPQCYPCGGLQMPALYRIADERGRTGPEDLLPEVARNRVTSYAADWEHGQVYLGVCQEAVFCGGEGFLGVGAKGVVLQSADGGVTWREVGVFPPSTRFVGVASELILETRDGSSSRVWGYQSGTTIEPPETPAPARPIVLDNASLVWRTEDGTYYDQSGAVLFSPLFAEKKPTEIVSADARYLYNFVRWTGATSSTQKWSKDPWYEYLGLIDKAGEVRGAWAWYGYDFRIVGAFPAEGNPPTQLFGNISVTGSLPQAAIFDLRSATIRTIPLPATEPEGTFPQVLHMSRYPFARVAGAGDCLNLREAPSLSAQPLACVADNVLLRVDGGVTEAETISWLQVRTPSGQPAWAAMQYLALTRD